MEKIEKLEAAQDEKKYRGWKAMPYIIGNETFEKIGTIGTTANLMVYLTTVFNMKRVSAALLINIWNGTTNLATLFGAFLSDSYFGRFKTLGFASVASFLGMVLVMLTAAIAGLHPPQCSSGSECIGPSPWQLGFLLFGLGFLVVGAGGIRPCNLAFGADQFNPETESGKRGINSFFNWYFFTFTFAVMVSLTVIIYVQGNVSWAWGFAIPVFLMMLSCVFFFVGSGIYVKIKPEGSPFISIAQVLTAAIKKRRLKLPDSPQRTLFNRLPKCSLNSVLPHTHQFSFLDKAAIKTVEDEMNPDGSPADPWRLCSVQQVEELKCLLRVIPIWSAGVLYYIVVVQNNTYVVVQALQSDRRLGHASFKIPAASFTMFAMFALTIWIPIYDRLIVPATRRLTGKDGGITLLQRVGIGLFLSIVSMVVSGVVERHRRHVALQSPTLDARGMVSSMSALWLVPQLTISGLSEAFSVIGQIEFYYKQFPENMRSVAGSLFFIGMACANYLSGLMVGIVHQTTNSGDGDQNWLPENLNKGRLEYFYFMIAAIEAVNLVYFLACSSWYRYKGERGAKPSEIGMESNDSKASPVLGE